MPYTVTVSWWIDTDFYGKVAAFNAQAKVQGDHGLTPALRRFFEKREDREHREQSELPAKRGEAPQALPHGLR